MADIIADLNTRGVLTKKGKLWNSSSFNRILSNERYVGVYIYKDIRIPGGIPSIVTQTEFDAVQCHLHLKPNPRRDKSGNIPQRRRRENSVYLLTGKLFCGHCKEPMVGLSGTSKTSDPHYYYTCKGRRANPHSCSKKNLRRDYIEHYVASALREMALTNDAIHKLADAAIAYQKRLSTNFELKNLRHRLSETDRALNNLLRAMEASIFSATTQNRMMELESERQNLTRLIAVAESELESQLTREEIVATLEMFQHGDLNDKDYQEALIDTFLVAAYVYDDRIKFIFNLNGPKDLTLPLPIDVLPSSEVRIDEHLAHQTS